MDAEGDPDPECVPLVVAGNEVAVTSVSRGVNSPEENPSKLDEEMSSVMNNDGRDLSGETQRGLKRTTGEDEVIEECGVVLALTSPSPSASLQDVTPELRSSILEYWKCYYYRHRKDAKESEKLWAEKHKGLLVNCTNCKPEKQCMFEPGRARCTNCTKGKIRCSHMDTFKAMWIAEQVKTTPEIVRGVTDSEVHGSSSSLVLSLMKAERHEQLRSVAEASTQSQGSSDSQSRQRKRGRELQPKAARRPLRTSKRIQAAATDLDGRCSQTKPCAVSKTPDELDIIDRKQGSSSLESDPEMRVDQGSDISLGHTVNFSNLVPLALPVTTEIHAEQNLDLKQSLSNVDSLECSLRTQDNIFEDVRATSGGVLEDPSPVASREGVVNLSAAPGLQAFEETSHPEPLENGTAICATVVDPQAEYGDHTSPPDEDEEMEDTQSNATLQAWMYIVRAEAALKNGYSEEVKSYLDGAIGYCEALFH
ncbi:hypothetical protein E1B28_004972 [Marasmius oreades]|uniref:Uncharacterized protein n=1 Tax=Marasmius oreades TaxID=181124 RepID=A0A9P7UZW8_9AGAR|nr:uncharacterized protein E1B28_004972 [Marasmius oreades]KAG7097640.1 hypothetical protein E1B28_004972 [Marasmius oreades]